jgi:Glycosyltransferases, probably involved in cell wall biogenesis
MIYLTSIQNLAGTNNIFGSTFGVFMWDLCVILFTSVFFIIQGLSLIFLIYNFFLQAISLRKPKRNYDYHAPEKRFIVFIPAHNEENVVPQLVDNLLNRMNYPKELLDVYVIADNCTDDTAMVARNAGAKVIEHFSAPDEPKGKPHGMKYAFEQIGDYMNNFDFVAIFDADNLVSIDYFTEMNSQLMSNDEIKVSQGYLDCKNCDSSVVSLGYSLSYYQSNRFFCYARQTLNLAPVIGGTGFVMAVDTLNELGWTVDSLTEDLEFQMQCVLNDKKIVWNHFAPIYDEKPTGFKQSIIQRVRWARGHWTVERRYFGPLIKKIIGTYFKTGKIDFTSIDSALYCIAPLTTGVSPIILAINALTLKRDDLMMFALMSVGMFTLSIILSNYALRRDTKQMINSSLPRMIIGLLWYMSSAMVVYMYGILTYTTNVWVRTEHKEETGIQDLLAIIDN